MIRVTVELIPYGDESRTRHLGTAIIANDGQTTLYESEQLGSYNVTLSTRRSPEAIWRRGRVESFPRKRLGAWDLLYRALAATVGDRK